jgi:hypothetical protein
MNATSDTDPSPLRRQAADALRRARKLPVGHDRNDLRQMAVGLLWLERRGFVAATEGSGMVVRKIKEAAIGAVPPCHRVEQLVRR